MQARDALKIRVFDSDTFGSDDSLGTMSVDMISAMHQYLQGNKPQWFKLCGEGCGDGEVKLAFEFYPRPPADLISEPISSDESESISDSSDHVNADTLEGSNLLVRSKTEDSIIRSYEPRTGIYKTESLPLRACAVPDRNARNRQILVGDQTSTLLAATSRGPYGQASTKFGSVISSAGGQAQGMLATIKMQACKYAALSIQPRMMSMSIPVGCISTVTWEIQFVRPDIEESRSVPNAIHKIDLEHRMPGGYRSLNVDGKEIKGSRSNSRTQSVLNLLWDPGRSWHRCLRANHK